MTVTFPIETHSQRAVLGVALAFSILAVTARLVYLAAAIFGVGLQSISITGVIQAGIGYGHVTEITLDERFGLDPITKLSKLIIPLQFLWVLSLSYTKISILFLYLRIFPVRWLVWSSWATITVIVAWALATILAGCLICRPFAFNWDQTILGGKCGNQVTSFTVTGVVNLVTDVVVLVIPMPSLYKLQMATYKKVTLIAVFGLGVVTCVISALRISVLPTMDFTDITYTIPKANIFSGIEPCLAVILASVPMMRPLLGRTSTTPDATGRTPVKSLSKSGGKQHSGPGDDDGFQALDDDTSQLWLRPLGPKYQAGISGKQANGLESGRDGDSGGSQESLDRVGGEARLGSGHSHENGGRNGHGGITVKQEWAVENGRLGR
ncbi:hypothetical protein BJX70DRAFT_397001 [Aspergillus crustosus]